MQDLSVEIWLRTYQGHQLVLPVTKPNLSVFPLTVEFLSTWLTVTGGIGLDCFLSKFKLQLWTTQVGGLTATTSTLWLNAWGGEVSACGTRAVVPYGPQLESWMLHLQSSSLLLPPPDTVIMEILRKGSGLSWSLPITSTLLFCFRLFFSAINSGLAPVNC